MEKAGGGKWGEASRDLLEKYGVDVVYRKEDLVKDNLHNICYAINGHAGIHSFKYAEAVNTRLQAVASRGKALNKKPSQIAELLKEELSDIGNGKDIESGNFFWNK